MFVSETNVFNPSSYRIRISTLEGINTIMEVSAETTVDQLKMVAVSEMYDSAEGVKLSLYYRLLSVNTGRVLNDESTIMQAGIKDNDELLLLKKRISMTNVSFTSAMKDQTDKIPTLKEIEKATANVAPLHLNVQIAKPNNTSEFQKEFRKILVSLIDIAQKILCLNPQSLQDASKYVVNDKIKRAVRKETSPPVNGRALDQLTSMGFDRNRAIKALRISKMSQTDAIQWLVDNPDAASGGHEERSAATDAEGGEMKDAAAAAASRRRDEVEEDGEETTKNLEKSLFELTKLSAAEKVKKMLKAFQQNRRLEFKPDPNALRNLLEMGFDEDDVIDALRVKNNQQEESCEWLLSRDGEESNSEPDIKEGLDENGAVYKAILSNHVIQLAVSNPKTLNALLQILENPNSMQQWLQDPELSPMLLQISKIYHSEKYSQ